MSNRNLFACILMACFLTVGFLGIAPVANAASAGQSLLNPGDRAKNNVIEIKDRRPSARIYLPIVPYIAYDYPYYYSRGHYPTHIRPGYIYNGFHVVELDDYDDANYEGAPYSSKERCARRFRSFEWDTGLYATYGGIKKLCPYLR